MTPAPPQPPAQPLHFRPRHRLAHARQFQAVFGAKVRKSRGPLTVFAAPNGLEHPRLGLSVGVRVGAATVRNAVKRRIREAFRLSQGRIAPGLDYVVTVQPHELRGTPAYEEAFVACCEGVAREWAKRAAARPATPPSAPVAKSAKERPDV